MSDASHDEVPLEVSPTEAAEILAAPRSEPCLLLDCRTEEEHATARIEGSDALFNLGFALAAARLLPGGVWIAMHGTIWPWDSVQKNRSAGRFETRD